MAKWCSHLDISLHLEHQLLQAYEGLRFLPSMSTVHIFGYVSELLPLFHNVKENNYTRICEQKSMLTVNGQFPGPTITAQKGEVFIVNVYNQGNKPITIHWHGVDQPRNPWHDGPEFITQCPINPGANFTYTVVLSEEEGTLWWHAHTEFDRASVHGAIIIHPKHGTDYPFKKPHKDIPIILGEWWKANVSHILEEALRTGSGINISDATTINGQPGDLFPCSEENTFKVSVKSGKTYLLRIINAGLTNDLFFGVAEHLLTIVGTEGRYLKPFTVENIMISPGQTMDALLQADRSSNSSYYMASRTFASRTNLVYNNSTATAILEYMDAPPIARSEPYFPNLPASDNITAATEYTSQLRSLASKDHPVDVPTHVDEHMLITLATNILPCQSCENGNRLAASLNNVSFDNPQTDILDAYYYSITGVFEKDFPKKPPFFFNFTNDSYSKEFRLTKAGTKVKVLNYSSVVEVVFQDTAMSNETHPMHLHGFAFYVVGMGVGNFDKTKDPSKYNLVDPPYQNTVTVPKLGWTAMRFRATNPGVWFMHCHFDRHTVWGMSTMFIVKEGNTPESRMRPRPSNMPKCHMSGDDIGQYNQENITFIE
uniref:Laccase n=1 Tax=Aegilops tauschii TaxID=37682 RepID=M8AZY6_AEGTA